MVCTAAVQDDDRNDDCWAVDNEETAGEERAIDMSRRNAILSIVIGVMGATINTPSAAADAAAETVPTIRAAEDQCSTTISSVSLLQANAMSPPLSVSDATALTTTSTPKNVDWKGILQKASKKAVGGGKAGASAAVVQVCSLMWLRTSMNYQYRYGGNLQSSLKTLWDEGGIPRLYQGLPFALIQGPATRFGDTAANVGILALLESFPETQVLPLPVKTAFGSFAAGAWRIALMPIDASKTSMQVEGADGLRRLWTSVADYGPGPLYRGAFAQAAATAAGHFPWFLTYNFLNEQIPVVSSSDDLFLSLLRAAFLGLAASCVSDTVSNSLRVIKTTKQTAQLGKDVVSDGSQKELSYQDVVSLILEKDGVAGLFGRGLQTRLLTNAIQGAIFSVLWKYFQQVGAV